MRSPATRIFLVSLFLISVSCFVNGEDSSKNKFRDRKATDDELAYPNLEEDALLNTQCPKNLELRWQTEVSSSIYATPLIADINSDGKLDIVVPSFVHYLEVLEGSDGEKMPGWPAFHQSNVHASPLLYDIDKDGVREIALATYNGEVLFFRVSGYLMTDKLVVPRRSVRKDWYVGLNPDPVDRSHPDVHDDQLIQDAQEWKLKSQLNNSLHELDTKVPTSTEANLGSVKASKPESEGKVNASQIIDGQVGIMNMSQSEAEDKTNKGQIKTEIEMPKSAENSSRGAGTAGTINAEKGTQSGRRLLEDNLSNGSEEGTSDTKENISQNVQGATVENDEALEADADSSFELLRDNDELGDEDSYDYDDYVDESMWGGEEWVEAQQEKLEDYVHIDAHILCTPVIADIDNDGVSEMVVAVSYFFDHEYYDNPEHLKELGGIEIGKYVAGAIVAFNLDTKQVKWTRNLDLSTDTGNFRAFIYSSPTIVDLDGDGYLDILVGTSFGLFYILDHHGFMIVHYLVRALQFSVTQAIKTFAEARPPGIYKPDYIDALYTFYHERKPELVTCPSTPEWKKSSDLDLNGEAVPDEDDDGGPAAPVQENHEVDVLMTNDDILGDSIPSDQQELLRQFCNQTLKLRGGPRGHIFPGSHPVSFNRENRQLLRQRYYYATWKADGTRYMMLITLDGCYLVDRNFNFRRVQMRFPCKHTSEQLIGMVQSDIVISDKKGLTCHHFTLLDGEMIIDTVPDSRKQERRYLIYDMMAINQVSLVERPFSERWKMLEKEVIEPRNYERQHVYESRNPYYRYEMEPFRVRRKDFWPLSTVTKLLKEFIPKLSHDADGLIFQGWDDPYVPRTHEGLLKWKYPEMNSVDFLFEVTSDDRGQLYLYERGQEKLMDGNRVIFRDPPDPSAYSGEIVECSWDSEESVWVCMRVRADKSTPNDINTYRKVMKSIRDNITEDIVLNDILEIIQLPMYADRIKIDSKAHVSAGRRR